MREGLAKYINKDPFVKILRTIEIILDDETITDEHKIKAIKRLFEKYIK